MRIPKFIASCLISIATQSIAASPLGSQPSACNFVRSIKSPTVFLATSDGKVSDGPIAVGTLSFETLLRDEGSIRLNTPYDVISNDPNYIPTAVVSNGMSAVLSKKKHPRCPGTTEYKVSFHADSTRLLPGALELEPTMEFSNPKDEFDQWAAKAFDGRIVGVVKRPWPNLVMDKRTESSIAKFFENGQSNLVLSIENVGNIPLIMRGISQGIEGISITISNCTEKPLEP
ncbi:hypothetical protein E4K72_16240 [Oxalobacteraceae bacterium OM1]|nr:hypothetical protein E4K72_16240 [Oxalobacteraceae bacterium OM1]